MSKDVTDTIKDTGKNIRDSVDETMHRSAADAERARRKAEGDEMTTRDKVASTADEMKHRTQAEIDATKRHLRDAPGSEE